MVRTKMDKGIVQRIYHQISGLQAEQQISSLGQGCVNDRQKNRSTKICSVCPHTHTAHVPVKSLRTDRLQLIPLLPPRPPTRILQTHPIGDGVLLARHAPPRPPNVLLLPVVRQIIDLPLRLGLAGGVVRHGVRDGDEEDREVARQRRGHGHHEGQRGERRRGRLSCLCVYVCVLCGMSKETCVCCVYSLLQKSWVGAPA